MLLGVCGPVNVESIEARWKEGSAQGDQRGRGLELSKSPCDPNHAKNVSRIAQIFKKGAHGRGPGADAGARAAGWRHAAGLRMLEGPSAGGAVPGREGGGQELQEPCASPGPLTVVLEGTQPLVP